MQISLTKIFKTQREIKVYLKYLKKLIKTNI